MLTKWRCIRIFLPILLKTIEFHSNKAGKSIKEALTFLQSIEGKRKPNMEKAPMAIVPKSWKAIVLKQDDAIDQKAYTFCVLEQLVEGLCRRDLFVIKE